MTRARIPTTYGVYTFDVDDIRSLTLSLKHKGERFVPLKESGDNEPWVLTIELSHIEDSRNAPSLWAYAKDWWQMRKRLRGVQYVDSRRS